ncbi:leucine-rich repeat domain-containing protein [Barnesiella intestinihominis]|uniref:leucine-rich repeat domain-containing protein n=1 Tax=Barnesiella intestinihominis TaxID=487174 RepID=UPI003A86C270
MRKQIIKFLFLLLAFGYAMEAKSGEFTVDGIRYYYTNEDDDEVSVTYSSSGKYSGNIVIPSTVTYNGKQYTVTKIGTGAFRDCTGLTAVTLPNAMTSIGRNAFRDCTGLTTVTISNSVTSIGSYAFYGCTGLTEVTIPNAMTDIGGWAFTYCTGLQTVIWNAHNVQDIPLSKSGTPMPPFLYCKNLTDFVFGDEVEHIPAYLCYNLTSLKNLVIGNSVTTIGSYAFSSCTGLKKVIWNARNANGFQYDTPFSDCENLTDFVFGDEVEHIPDYLCYNLTSLKNLVIGNSVTTIRSHAFKGCTGLTEVTIPNAVTSIGSRAFSGCTGLTEVTIPNAVTYIGERAFEGCSGLTTVTIGNSVTTIEERAFTSCSGLTTVIWNARNAEYYNGLSYDSPFSNCDRLTDFVFGEEVEHIPALLCCELASLKNLVIGNSVTSIGISAFDGCSGLTEVIWNARNVQDFQDNSSRPFSGCDRLTDFVFGEEVEHIPDYLCYQLTSLNTIVIPNSVTSIGTNAFSFCSGLKTVTIPNSVTNIGSSAFEDCTELKTVTIGNSVTDIGDEAFSSCFNLTEVSIPNSVTSIGDEAFYFCTDLKTVTIGNSVKSIGDKAFYHCSSLEHVTSKAVTPPQIWAMTFDDYGMPFYVPAGCKPKYAEAEYWNNFTDIRETGVTLHTVTANATDETMGYVTGGGEYPQGSTATLIAVPFGQNYFVRWNDGNTDNPRTITVTGDMTFTAEFAPAGSAVETLENGERGIYATGRTLHVENGGESYRVYTAAGRLVYTGNDSSVTLSAPGMYIVRTGDRSQKVAVK